MAVLERNVVKRFVALLLVVLVGLPSLAFAPSKPAACAMPGEKAAASCDYCVPAAPLADAGARFEAGCCRFLPNQESTQAQAGSVGATPKPHHAPDAAAMIPGISVPGAPLGLALRAPGTLADSPPLASPTRTTHLLL